MLMVWVGALRQAYDRRDRFLGLLWAAECRCQYRDGDHMVHRQHHCLFWVEDLPRLRVHLRPDAYAAAYDAYAYERA